MPVPITVLSVRGLGETMHANMLTNVTRQLDRTRFRVVDVPYDPAFGPIGGKAITDQALWAAVEQGVAALTRLTAEAPGPVATVGYSFGTLVTNEHLKRNRANGKIRLAANLASARRKPGRSYGLAIPASLGGGIYGDWVDDSRLWADVAWPGDVVTNLPTRSLIRDGASLIAWMSLVDPLRWANDVAHKLPGLIFNAYTSGAAPQVIEDTVRSIPMVDGYVRFGEHTARYGEKHWRDWQGRPISGIDLLARCLNGVKA